MQQKQEVISQFAVCRLGLHVRPSQALLHCRFQHARGRALTASAATAEVKPSLPYAFLPDSCLHSCRQSAAGASDKTVRAGVHRKKDCHKAD